jgi:beta-phosphoglucomutase-like phosphatase (HAD superfamily)
MSMRRMAGLLFASGLAAGLGAGMTVIAVAVSGGRFSQAWNETAGYLGGNDQAPLVAARCQDFGSAAEILELG